MEYQSINDVLFSPRIGGLDPLFPSEADFFRKIVSVPGHAFSKHSESKEDQEQKVKKFKQRWYRLVQGIRKNRIDPQIEKALRLLLDGVLPGSDQERNNLQNDILVALRKSNSKAVQPINAGNISQSISTQQYYSQFLNSIKSANTIYLVCDVSFVEYLFSNKETDEISEQLWLSILFHKNPHIRIYLPWEDSQRIWDILFRQLKLYLIEHPEKIDQNGSQAEYTLIRNFYDGIKTHNKKKVRDSLVAILTNSNTKNVASYPRYRLFISGNKLPKMFSTPYVIVDPRYGQTGMYSLCRRYPGLDVFKWDEANIDIWKKYDKEYYMNFSNKPSIVRAVRIKVSKAS